MKRRILQKPQAERDLVEIFAFIARDKLKPAMRFLRLAAETFEKLASMPTLGRALNFPGFAST